MTTPSSSRSLRPLAAPVAARAFLHSEWSNPHFRRLFVLNMAYGYCFSALLLVPKYAATWLSASAAEIGELQAGPVIVGILAAPLCGRLLDRGGWRLAIRLGGTILALSTMAFGAVREMGPLIYLLRGAHGLGNVFLIGGSGALVTRLVPREHHARAFGTVGAASLMMNAGASLATERLADAFGWGVAFEVAGFAAFIALGVSTALPALAQAPSAHLPQAPGAVSWLRERAVDYGAAAAGAGFAMIATFTQPFALSLGASRVAVLFAGYTLTALFVRLVLSGVADRVGRRRSAIVSLAAYAVATLMASQLHPSWLFELGLLFGFAHGLAWPMLNALAVERAAPGRTGSALTRVQASFGIGSMCAVWGGGWLVERFGYPLAFTFASGAVVTGALALAAARDAPER
jgi:MFS family permease